MLGRQWPVCEPGIRFGLGLSCLYETSNQDRAGESAAVEVALSAPLVTGDASLPALSSLNVRRGRTD